MRGLSHYALQAPELVLVKFLDLATALGWSLEGVAARSAEDAQEESHPRGYTGWVL